MIGPGKYDELCTYVREAAQARGAIVIVLDGIKGSGFSCQTEPDVLLTLPELLEDIAEDIRAGRAKAGWTMAGGRFGGAGDRG